MDAAFDAAVALIEQHLDVCDFSGPQPAERIEAAERLLGITLPAPYRDFVLRFGAGGYGPHEFYGVYKDEMLVGPIPNMVWLTLKHRESGDLPSTMIVIYHDGAVSFYVIDTVDGDDPPVRIWTPGLSDTSQPLGIITKTFGEFLLETATDEFA